MTEITITTRPKWGGPGIDTFISDGKTVYAISFVDTGQLRIHACKIHDAQGILFDHDPDRGVSINLTDSTCKIWGLKPANMAEIYRVLIPGDERTLEVMNLREKIAKLEHEQWAHWTRYFLCNINAENIARWNKQIETPYEELPYEQKDTDRKWADTVLEILLKTETGDKIV